MHESNDLIFKSELSEIAEMEPGKKTNSCERLPSTVFAATLLDYNCCSSRIIATP